MKEIVAPFIELTIPEAAKLFNMGESAVRYRCERGIFDAYRTDGDRGHWRVKLRPNEVMPKEEAENIKRENAELKSKLESLRKLLAV